VLLVVAIFGGALSMAPISGAGIGGRKTKISCATVGSTVVVMDGFPVGTIVVRA